MKSIFNSNSPTSIIAAGVIMWLVALLVSIVVGANSQVITICAIGAALGVVGIIYSRRRLARESKN
jgi:FtsH-binding integral membrane protein